MTDLVNVHLTKAANAVIDHMEATGCFENKITVARFAMAYAIKNHFDEIDPATFQLSDSEGSNFSLGTVDPDGQIAALFRALYPSTSTPYLFTRAFMVFGLAKLGERFEQEGLRSISALM